MFARVVVAVMISPSTDLDTPIERLKLVVQFCNDRAELCDELFNLGGRHIKDYEKAQAYREIANLIGVIFPELETAS